MNKSLHKVIKFLQYKPSYHFSLSEKDYFTLEEIRLIQKLIRKMKLMNQFQTTPQSKEEEEVEDLKEILNRYHIGKNDELIKQLMQWKTIQEQH